MSPRRELERIIEKELANAPDVEWWIDRRGRTHPRLHLRLADKERVLVLAGTPSCYRGMLNRRRDIRRTIEEMRTGRKWGLHPAACRVS